MPHPSHVPYPPEEHSARLKEGDVVAQAYEWIYAYAANLTQAVEESHSDDDDWYGRPVTVEDLMDAADSHQDTDSWGDYIVRGGTFEGEYVDPTFWAKYAILRGKELDDVKQNSFFSCSC